MSNKKVKYPAAGTNDYRLTGVDCVTLSPAAFAVGLRTVAGGHILNFGAYDRTTRKLTVATGDPGKVGAGSVLILWTCAIDGNSPYRVTVIAVDQVNKTLTLGADLPVTALHIEKISEWVGAVRDLTSDDSALASGEQVLALGRNAFASGTLSIATGRGAHAEGVYCEARGDMSFAAGSGSIAVGDGAFALGENVKAAAKKSVVIGSDGELADTPDNTGALAIVCDGAAMLKIFANKSVSNPLYGAPGEPEYTEAADRGLQYAGHLLPVTVTITGGSALVLDHGVAARWKVTPTEEMTPVLINWRDGDRGELIVRNGNAKINFPAEWIWIGTQPTLKTNGADIFPILKIDDEIYIYGEAAASGGGNGTDTGTGLIAHFPLSIDHHYDDIVGDNTATLVSGVPVFDERGGASGIGSSVTILFPAFSEIDGLDTSKDFSVSVEYRMHTHDKQRIFITDPSAESQFQICYWDGALMVKFCGVAATLPGIEDDFADWDGGYERPYRKIVMTKISNVVYLYRNGVLVASGAAAMYSGFASLAPKIGKYSYDDGDNNFWGWIKDFKIYNTGLTEEQIASL